MEKTIELDIPLVAPDIDDAQDDCLCHLEAALQNQRGILKAHVKYDKKPPQLCLHYDPNLISLTAVQRIAHEAGSEFTNRYRHEQIPFTGMSTADAAIGLAQSLENLPGMIHASVNYAAGLAFVAYDTEQLERTAVEQAMRQMGYKPVTETAVSPAAAKEDHDHDHGSAPSFLPHAIQEKWTYILVASAGVFFLIGWLGETFFAMNETVALIFFILSYITGGYDVATHAIPALFKGKFDTDILMLAAATGAALLGSWSRALSCSSSSVWVTLANITRWIAPATPSTLWPN
jgi:Cd2+/Zn2+-exporting ATPase